jgi:Aspartyl protease
MKVGNEFLATQLTVMENNDMPFLFGLDMLRRHQCQIDLKCAPVLKHEGQLSHCMPMADASAELEMLAVG